ERAAAPGPGLHHHRVVREPADLRETDGGPGRADEGVGEEPGELGGVQPDGGDPVAAGPGGTARLIRTAGPLGVQRGGSRRHPGGPAGSWTVTGGLLSGGGPDR